tara:strand:+ start:960 stop:2123 length:1164 start_codon:yes stop_codon:yes gene_type:complete
LANIGWGESTWGNNAWGGQLDVAVSPTGVAATSALGTVAASSIFVIEVTGLAATSAVGSVLAKIPITAVVTGVEGSMPFGGWGIDGFGQGNWGGLVAEGIPIGGTTATSVVATTTLGGLSGVTGTSVVTPTGVSGTGAIGNALAGAGALVTETGMVGTIGLGDESVVGTALVTPSGVSSTVSISGYSATRITKTVTVQSVSSANKYFIDGVQQQTQELFERNIYRFDQSDSSNSGHPLRFSTTSNGSHAGGSEYTTGVTVNGTPGQAGAYTEITVPEFTPTLYYYCTQHSGMGGTANTPFVYNVLPTTGAPVTGVAGTSALGTVTTEHTAVISPTGVFGTSALGTLAMQGSCVLTVTGVNATGATGEENIWGDIVPSQTPNWTEIAA